MVIKVYYIILIQVCKSVFKKFYFVLSFAFSCGLVAYNIMESHTFLCENSLLCLNQLPVNMSFRNAVLKSKQSLKSKTCTLNTRVKI